MPALALHGQQEHRRLARLRLQRVMLGQRERLGDVLALDAVVLLPDVGDPAGRLFLEQRHLDDLSQLARAGVREREAGQQLDLRERGDHNNIELI